MNGLVVPWHHSNRDKYLLLLVTNTDTSLLHFSSDNQTRKGPSLLFSLSSKFTVSDHRQLSTLLVYEKELCTIHDYCPDVKIINIWQPPKWNSFVARDTANRDKYLLLLVTNTDTSLLHFRVIPVMLI